RQQRRRMREERSVIDPPRWQLPPLFSAFTGFGQALAFGILLATVAMIVYLIIRAILSVKYRNRPSEEPLRGQAVKEVLGMNVEQEKLPPHLVKKARSLWESGAKAECIRLLYRGALSWLAHQGRVAIQESDTEMDCLQRVESEASQVLSYFHRLTSTWIGSAYGQELPSEDWMEALFQDWPFAPGKGGAS
ncbi:MAG: DUF4129 domain-containing protein, partial [Verrucomicrobiota bacterium]